MLSILLICWKDVFEVLRLISIVTWNWEQLLATKCRFAIFKARNEVSGQLKDKSINEVCKLPYSLLYSSFLLQESTSVLKVYQPRKTSFVLRRTLRNFARALVWSLRNNNWLLDFIIFDEVYVFVSPLHWSFYFSIKCFMETFKKFFFFYSWQRNINYTYSLYFCILFGRS